MVAQKGMARPVVRDSPGLLLTRSRVAGFTGVHQHSEIELGAGEGGPLSMFFGGRRHTRRMDHLVVFWGAVPHGAIEIAEGNRIGYSLHIPMPLFMSWQLPPDLVSRVLQGQMIEDQAQVRPCSDPALLRHWHHLMAGRAPEAREVVMLEVQARLRRLAMTLPNTVKHDTCAVPPAGTSRGVELFERMLAAIQARHASPLTVREIARSAGIGPDHAMHIFREVCGETIYEHLTRCRIFTAQRLLATTDTKVAAVGQASGFPSSDCFHDAFKRICGCTPRRYRLRLRGGPSVA